MLNLTGVVRKDIRSSFAGLTGTAAGVLLNLEPTLVSAATEVRNKIATSQIALPKTACDAAYATSDYATSVTNLSRITLATDGIFSDGASLELATVTGDTTSGMTATLTVAV